MVFGKWNVDYGFSQIEAAFTQETERVTTQAEILEEQKYV